MTRRHQTERRVPSLLISTYFLLILCLSGCSHVSHTYDPRYNKMDDMLSKQLRPGTPRSLVLHFLVSRGYKLEEPNDKTTVLALVRIVDTDTLQPLTAHATFHFDTNDKLTTFELKPAQSAPVP
jgi:hypothetical protein